ncbi:MAG: M56 family metallopeptidase [Oligoflexia bacterium]|nr:M56 family metallopeptidase [Oligoflexia bacterium]
MTTVFFNLLVNAIFSLIAGTIVVLFFLWLFRIQTGGWKLFLLSLPFLKIIYDFSRGVPHNSILYSNIDTFSMPPRHHYLEAGAGLSTWGPTFMLQFKVKDINGNFYSESIGDYLALWLQKSFGQTIPVLILALVIFISVILVIRRFYYGLHFERVRKENRKQDLLLNTKKIGNRTIDIYLSRFYSGSPFTGGILYPYICIPFDAYEKLSTDELNAVIAHEIGHIRHFDVFGTLIIKTLGDFFWFIPTYRWLSRKIDRIRELVADQWAVRSGAQPEHLASSLLKLKEIPSPKEFILYSAFFREKSLLKTRIEKLLSPEKEPKARFGWQNKWVRLFVGFWISTAVLSATLGGNHRAEQFKNPKWVDQVLESWGLAAP